MKSICSSVTAILFLTGVICAQDVPLHSISGKVVDVVTKEALPNVNVYLANTMIGTTTNVLGEFVIKNVPVGSYDLVISLVGYERQIVNIRLFQPLQRALDVRLREKPFETGPVDITAKDPTEWRKGLRKFTDYLFGKTKNGAECRILNPEILDFKDDPSSNVFHASAREPVQIENRALGYRIELILQVFSVNATEFRYGGVVRFEEVKTSDTGEEERWEKNRLKTYKGSLLHFLLALLKDDLDREGFVISRTKDLPFLNSRVPFRESVSWDDILKPGEFSFERVLRFRDYLEVRYKQERPEPGFYDFWMSTTGWKQYENDTQQISWLSMDVPFLRMTTAGRLFDPYALKTHGYWSFERIGEWLPLEFQIPSQ